MNHKFIRVFILGNVLGYC